MRDPAKTGFVGSRITHHASRITHHAASRKEPEMVSVGIIGCGNMGRTHARNLAKLPGVRLRGYADPRTEAAEALRQECGGEVVVAEAERLLEDPSVDLVFV